MNYMHVLILLLILILKESTEWVKESHWKAFAIAEKQVKIKYFMTCLTEHFNLVTCFPSATSLSKTTKTIQIIIHVNKDGLKKPEISVVRINGLDLKLNLIISAIRRKFLKNQELLSGTKWSYNQNRTYWTLRISTHKQELIFHWTLSY